MGAAGPGSRGSARASEGVGVGHRRQGGGGAGAAPRRLWGPGAAGGGRTERAWVPVPSLFSPSPRLFSRAFTLSSLPLQAPAVRSASGGRRERGGRASTLGCPREATWGAGPTCPEAHGRVGLCAPGYPRLAARGYVATGSVHSLLHHLWACWNNSFPKLGHKWCILPPSLGGRRWNYVNRGLKAAVGAPETSPSSPDTCRGDLGPCPPASAPASTCSCRAEPAFPS